MSRVLLKLHTTHFIFCELFKILQIKGLRVRNMSENLTFNVRI